MALFCYVPCRILSFDCVLSRQEWDFCVKCSKGTYIRSLCADLALSLNRYSYCTGHGEIRVFLLCDPNLSSSIQVISESFLLYILTRRVLHKHLYPVDAFLTSSFFFCFGSSCAYLISLRREKIGIV